MVKASFSLHCCLRAVLPRLVEGSWPPRSSCRPSMVSMVRVRQQQKRKKKPTIKFLEQLRRNPSILSEKVNPFFLLLYFIKAPFQSQFPLGALGWRSRGWCPSKQFQTQWQEKKSVLTGESPRAGPYPDARTWWMKTCRVGDEEKGEMSAGGRRGKNL